MQMLILQPMITMVRELTSIMILITMMINSI